jgi:hypothetical protein
MITTGIQHGVPSLMNQQMLLAGTIGNDNRQAMDGLSFFK